MSRQNRASKETANIDPERIARRDGHTCQNCGCEIAEGDTARVCFIGHNQNLPGHYETRCEPCSRTFMDRCNRMVRYLFVSILSLFAIPSFAVGLSMTLTTLSPFTLIGRGVVDYLLYTYVGGVTALAFWLVAAVVYIQITIWIEPPNGIIYRVASWTQKYIVTRVAPKAQSMSARVANKW